MAESQTLDAAPISESSENINAPTVDVPQSNKDKDGDEGDNSLQELQQVQRQDQRGEEEVKQQKRTLLSLLSKQLLYYFSSTNLSKDTYLKTIMGLNSGYVPVVILANFQNVHRILSSFPPSVFREVSSNDAAIATDADVTSAKEQENVDKQSNTNSNSSSRSNNEPNVPELLRTAAQLNNLLEVVVLNQHGKLLRRFGEPESPSSSSSSSTATGTKELTLVAIGPKDGNELGAVDAEGLNVNVTVNVSGASTAASATPSPVSAGSTAESAPSQPTIILRDVPEQATEKDIRGIFGDDQDGDESTIVTHVRREFGNCW